MSACVSGWGPAVVVIDIDTIHGRYAAIRVCWHCDRLLECCILCLDVLCIHLKQLCRTYNHSSSPTLDSHKITLTASVLVENGTFFDMVG